MANTTENRGVAGSNPALAMTGYLLRRSTTLHGNCSARSMIPRFIQLIAGGSLRQRLISDP
jgi:hypothetical protein